MTSVYVLAHFDDEYAALPLLLEDRRAGRAPWLLYVADYADPAVSARRLAETRALVAHLGLPADQALHVGGGTGVLDGAVCENLPAAYTALEVAIAGVGPIERIVTLAWEGGHADHDCCAFMAETLRRNHAPEAVLEQFPLYHGKGLGGSLFRACATLTENGPTRRVPMTAGEWLDFAAAVRFFPSQAKTWLALWPSMFATFLLRGGFHVQTLQRVRVRTRPHDGALLYERMFKTPYERVRSRLDDFRA